MRKPLLAIFVVALCGCSASQVKDNALGVTGALISNAIEQFQKALESEPVEVVEQTSGVQPEWSDEALVESLSRALSETLAN